MHLWVSCLEPALYEAQSTQSEAAGWPPLPVCGRHAEHARRYWSVLYIRPIIKAAPGEAEVRQGEGGL